MQDATADLADADDLLRRLQVELDLPLPIFQELQRATNIARMPAVSADDTQVLEAVAPHGSEASWPDDPTVPAADEPTAEEQDRTNGFDSGLRRIDERREAPAPDAPRRREIVPGTILKDRFLVLAPLGQGGMGMVYKAVDVTRRVGLGADRALAIKVIRSGAADPGLALEHEWGQARRLNHPNIVNVYDFDTDGTLGFMTMELLEGETLAELLRRTKPHRLPRERALEIIRCVANGLAYAHGQGVVHRDLKPANVFLSWDGTVKLLDFGVARDSTDGGLRIAGSATPAAATPVYAAPEVMAGDDPDPRDDVFSLGCLAYELLAGEHPYLRLSASAAARKRLRPKAVPELESGRWRVLKSALSFQRKDRPHDAATFMALFDEAPAEAASRRSEVSWPFVAVAAAAVVGTGVWSLNRGEPDVVQLPVSEIAPAEVSLPVAESVSPEMAPAAEPAPAVSAAPAEGDGEASPAATAMQAPADATPADEVTPRAAVPSAQTAALSQAVVDKVAEDIATRPIRNPASPTSMATTTERGEARVAVSAPAAEQPARAAEEPPPVAVGADVWFVQVGSFSNRGNSQRALQALEARGYAAVEMPLQRAQGPLYRVRVGPLPTREAAGDTATRLKAEGEQTALVRLTREQYEAALR